MPLKFSLAQLMSTLFVVFILVGCNRDDGPTVEPVSITFNTASGSIAENSSTPFTVTINSSVAAPGAGSVDVAITGADYATDYTTSVGSANFSVNFAQGATFGTFTVQPIDNAEVDGNKTLTITLSNPTGLVELGNSSSFSLTIEDDDMVPPPNMISLADLRGLYSGTDLDLTDENLIEGVVISTNDATNNQNLIIQNGTDGILVRFTSAHSIPRGQNVQIQLQGGTLTDFNNLVQVGNIDLSALTDNGAGTLPTPQVVTIAQLNTGDFESELVTVEGGSFPAANGTATVNGNNDYTVGSETTIVRVSGPDWSSNILPRGMGDITGVAGVFGNDVQILPQVPEEFFADDDTGSGDPVAISIADVRAMYTEGMDVNINTNSTITGIVISDLDATNGQNAIIQSGTDGIVVRFNENHNFARGNEVVVNISGATLSDFNGLVQLTGLELASATDNGVSTLPDAQIVTISEFKSGDFESELVTIQGAFFPDADGSSTVNGNNDLVVNMDTTVVRVSGASWSSNLLPLGMGDVTGIGGVFQGTVQVLPQIPEDFFASMSSGMIIVAGTVTDFGNVTTSTSSASQTIMVSAQMATADLIVTASDGFEVSLNDTDFSSSVMIDAATANANATDVFVRFSPTSGVSGTQTGMITITSAGLASSVIDISGSEESATGSSVIAGTSFEEGTVGAQYVDTGDATMDHDLVNNDGQSWVDFTGTTTEIGVDAIYINTRDDVGLTDGDFVGFTDFAGTVGEFTDGTQGYQMSDTDGLMRIYVDTVDVRNFTNVAVNIDLFVQSTGWEDSDHIRIWVVSVDGNTSTETEILNTTGMDIDDNFSDLEDTWTTLGTAISSSTEFVALRIELDSNSGSEAIFIDNIRITGNQ